jgi:predicted nucleic acid-binding Zn ribbon protein
MGERLKFPERISRIIPRVLEVMNIDGTLKNWHVVHEWETIVGSNIARHARAVSVDSENLYVMVDNPVWQSQLFLMKSDILRKIRKYDVRIKDIKFRISDAPLRRRGHGKKG